MSRNRTADYYNKYEIVLAAMEASIDLADPVWNRLSDREKWEAIITKNGENLKKDIPEYTPKSQKEIILEIIKKRKS